MLHSRTSKGVAEVAVNAVNFVVSLVYCRRRTLDALFSSLTPFTDDFLFKGWLSSLFGPVTGRRRLRRDFYSSSQTSCATFDSVVESQS